MGWGRAERGVGVVWGRAERGLYIYIYIDIILYYIYIYKYMMARHTNAHLDIQMSTMSVASESHFRGRFLFDGAQMLISRDVVRAIHTFVPR